MPFMMCPMRRPWSMSGTGYLEERTAIRHLSSSERRVMLRAGYRRAPQSQSVPPQKERNRIFSMRVDKLQHGSDLEVHDNASLLMPQSKFRAGLFQPDAMWCESPESQSSCM